MTRRRGKRVARKPVVKRLGQSAKQRNRASQHPRQRHNLPTQLTTFIGREREIAEVKRLLGTTRLLTLTGAAGCGKTRLALQVAAEFIGSQPDGVWLIELAAISDPALVPRAVLSTLGIPEPPRLSREQALATYLRGKSVVLLVDNCEHLRTACQGLVETLLRASPTVRIMATSREVLGAEGEVTYRVPSLSLPDNGRGFPVAQAARYDAIRLFAERAVNSQPGFALTEQNAQVIAQICRRLDGMPLAIEFAAARVRTLAIEQIAARLDDRFRLLTAGTRQTVHRHRTLRAAMDWSHDQLSESEKVMLRRLSVFASGWTLDAAEAVCTGGDLDAPCILDLLTQLADKSLVAVEMRAGAGRYHLLETVRQYGAEKLNESGESPSVRKRHLEWCLEFAERADLELRGPSQTIWLERLETEHDNVRAALAWSRTDRGGADAGLRLAGALHWFWRLHCHELEGCEWLRGALANTETSITARARALQTAGSLAYRLGDYREARAWLQQSIVMFGELGEDANRSFSLHQLAHVADGEGDAIQAVPLFEESLAIYRAAGDEWGTAFSLRCLGDALYRQGANERAASLLEDCLVLLRRVGDNWALSNALRSLGVLAGERKEYDRAIALFEESLAIIQPTADRWNSALTQCRLADMMLSRGHCARAVSLYRESLKLNREVGGKSGIADCLGGLARAAATTEQPKRAAQLFGAAKALRDTIHSHVFPADRADYERCVALAHSALGEKMFEAAWAKGATMTLEEAIAYALHIESTSLPGRSKIDKLTTREREVAALLAQGMTNRAIAARLKVAERTIDTHVEHILNKLGVASRTQVATWAVSHGLHTPAPG